MVDSTDLVVIASVVQTVVITLTLGVFIFQFRSQEKSIRESAVQNVMGRYTDYVRMLVEKPDLSKLLDFAERRRGPDGRLSRNSHPRTKPSTHTSCSATASSRRSTRSTRRSGWTRTRGSSGQSSSRGSQRTRSSSASTTRPGGPFDKDFQEVVSKLVQDSERDSS